MRGGVTDAGRQRQTLKIELLSQLEAGGWVSQKLAQPEHIAMTAPISSLSTNFESKVTMGVLVRPPGGALVASAHFIAVSKATRSLSCPEYVAQYHHRDHTYWRKSSSQVHHPSLCSERPNHEGGDPAQSPHHPNHWVVDIQHLSYTDDYEDLATLLRFVLLKLGEKVPSLLFSFVWLIFGSWRKWPSLKLPSFQSLDRGHSTPLLYRWWWGPCDSFLP